MILESVRVFADALGSSEYGVNVQIDTISRDADDKAPPHIRSIGDITRDKWAAELAEPPNLPALLVAPAGPATLSGEVLSTVIRDGESVPIDVIYIGRDLNGPVAFSDMMMTFRAVLRTLKDLMSNEKSDDRLRNNVCLIGARDVTWGLAEMPLESSGATGALTVTFGVRDNA